jgi:hypothetical protein
MFVSGLIRQLTDWERAEMIIATLVHIESDERLSCRQGINRPLVGQLTNNKPMVSRRSCHFKLMFHFMGYYKPKFPVKFYRGVHLDHMQPDDLVLFFCSLHQGSQ